MIIATYEVEDIIIGYNGEYLKDVINNTTGDEVTIKLNTPISATLFVGSNKNKNKVMLLMPVRINSWNKKTSMEISSINMISFRNHENTNISFDPGITIIWGENGSGKTSVLEAIHTLSMGKSFRTHRQKTLIKNGEKGYLIKGCFSNKQSKLNTKML